MTKKAVLLAALLLLILVPSAMATPKPKEPKPNNPKKTTFAYTESATLTAGNMYLGSQELSDSGILYIQDAISTGTINSGTSPISGSTIQTTLSGTLDLNTYLGSYHGKWTITSQNGAFEGTINGKVAVATVYGHFVGHGTGEFEDQKISGTFEGSVNNFQVEITIQATITSNTK